MKAALLNIDISVTMTVSEISLEIAHAVTILQPKFNLPNVYER